MNGTSLGEPCTTTNKCALINPIATPLTTPGSQASGDNPSDRRRRLETALIAIQDSGNTMMIESLKAAIEGRKANLNFPPLPGGLASDGN
jgi:hypothetical protein